MKKESGKDNRERQEIKQTEQEKKGKGRKKHEAGKKEKRQIPQAKKNGRGGLCAAISLGMGTILFSMWAFSGNDIGYTNESGYVALQKATGQGTSAGVLISEKKTQKSAKKKESSAAEETDQSEQDSETETESESESVQFDLEQNDEEGIKTEEESEEERKEERTDSEPVGKVVLETGTESDGLEMELTVELENTEGKESETGAEDSEKAPETLPETESELEDGTEEPPADGGNEGEKREENKKESETDLENGTEVSTERITENESEERTEAPATDGESEMMPESEPESSPEEAPVEEESETESEYETESETESETEAMPESKPESSPEEAPVEEESETESEYETESETEAMPESEPESSPEEAPAEEESETESETEAETRPQKTETEQESKREPEPFPVYRGEQYEIRGDENAWYRDETGRLWVRKGSSVYVDPAKRQGYTQGGSVTDVQQDGMLTFQLKKTDEKGTVIGVSTLQQEAYFVDGEVPEARIEPSGNLEDGVIYAAQSSAVTVTVPPDGKSGLKRVSYRISNEAGGNGDGSSGSEMWTDWTDCRGGEQITVSGEGVYRVYVRTEDRVGNLAFSSSAPICVDCTPPQIEIKGVQGETANSGSVPIRISCSDSFYRRGSLAVKIVGANNGKVPKIKASEEKEKSASTEFYDFPKEQTYDDAYRLEVQAEDLAGNITQKTLDFSINRFGSVYDLSGETKEALQPYYLTEATDIVFLEMNIDYVGESEIFCRENGELKKLNRGSDYTVELQGSSDSWKQYRYTIPAAYFEKEGIYELLLASRDRAKNESDTGLQGKQVTFALDWTAPECLITGVEALGVYPAEHQVAYIQPKDNLGIAQTRIYHDSELVQTAEDGAVKLKLAAKPEWQTIQVYVRDLAGNEAWSQEIPVFVSEETTEVLPYEKTRKSAQEKEEELVKRKAGYGAGGGQEAEAVPEKSLSDKDAEGDGNENGAKLEEEGLKKDTAKASLLGQTERIRRGRLLLGFGTLLFFVTFLVCILPPGKRKR